MRKVIGWCIVLMLSAAESRAQQLAQYSQHMLNNYVLNPAVAGSHPCMDFKLGYRTQWVGFDAQPKTMFASFYKTISFNKRSHSRIRHAVGGYVERDQTGPSSRTSLYLSYSIHVPLTRRYTLGAGIFGGFMQYAFSPSGLTTNLPDATVSGMGSKFIVPDFNPGLWLYSNRHYVGLSVKSILGNNISGNSKLNRHFYFTSGYKIAPGGYWAFIPSVFVRYSGYSPIGADFTLLADYSNRITFGASYRIRDGFIGMVKFNFGKWFIGYSYDFNTSAIRVANSNSHEVIIGLKICPTNFNSRNSGLDSDNPNINKCAAYN